MSLRVIAGEFGGRRLAAPPGRGTRPTKSAVREAWFNALANDVPGARVIDLFAGSGALGIEALSRGAAFARFIESDRAAFGVLRANLAALELGDRAEAVRGDVFREIGALEPREFDVALADPPYARGAADRLVGVWLDRPFAGILCVEHGSEELTEQGADWRRMYGDTGLSFFIASEES